MKNNVVHAIPQVDLLGDHFAQNKREVFRQLRETSPVALTSMRKQPVYILTRYHDIETALTSPDIIKDPNNIQYEDDKKHNPMSWLPPIFSAMMHSMLHSDDPNHRRLRTLVHKAFTPRMIETLEGRIETLAHRLLDDMLKQGTVDLLEAYALPIPFEMISEMLGIPSQDRPRFRKWSEAILVNPDPLSMMKSIPSMMACFNYIGKLANERRKNPQDDLLTGLVQAEHEGESLSEQELFAMVFLLMAAGHETTVGLITNGAHALLTNPEQLDHLRQHPDQLPTAIEELLRFDTPLMTGELNYARVPYAIEGTTIPTGSMIFTAILSANHDESVFTHPEQLDLTRQPNKHLAFGKGIHYCLGAPLARMEARVAFATLLERAPKLRLAVPSASLRYANLLIVNRLTNLPVSVS
ncbi:MAG: cytochrome P450 family protein [Phototrophicaceae bacterium]